MAVTSVLMRQLKFTIHMIMIFFFQTTCVGRFWQGKKYKLTYFFKCQCLIIWWSQEMYTSSNREYCIIGFTSASWTRFFLSSAIFFGIFDDIFHTASLKNPQIWQKWRKTLFNWQLALILFFNDTFKTRVWAFG